VHFAVRHKDALQLLVHSVPQAIVVPSLCILDHNRAIA
jgi:hypothetical protein